MPDQKFDDQLSAMIQAKKDGLIAGIGLSTITEAQLEHALQRTDVLCVQNPYNLLERDSQPVLDLCADYGIAFVPYFPLGSAFRAENPVLNHPEVLAAAERLGRTPAQTVLAWTLTRGAERAADPRHLVAGAPGGEPRGGRHRAGRGDQGDPGRPGLSSRPGLGTSGAQVEVAQQAISARWWISSRWMCSTSSAIGDFSKPGSPHGAASCSASRARTPPIHRA